MRSTTDSRASGSELSDIAIVEGASTQSVDAVEIIRDPAGRLRKWLILGAAAVGLYLIVVVLAGVIFGDGSQGSIPPAEPSARSCLVGCGAPLEFDPRRVPLILVRLGTGSQTLSPAASP